MEEYKKIKVTLIIVLLLIGCFRIDRVKPELSLKTNTYTIECGKTISKNELRHKLVDSTSDNRNKYLGKTNVRIRYYSKVNFYKEGTYPIEFTLTDSQGNMTTKSAKVIVEPNKEDRACAE